MKRYICFAVDVTVTEAFSYTVMHGNSTRRSIPIDQWISQYLFVIRKAPYANIRCNRMEGDKIDNLLTDV